jgi:hypothetical protein
MMPQIRLSCKLFPQKALPAAHRYLIITIALVRAGNKTVRLEMAVRTSTAEYYLMQNTIELGRAQSGINWKNVTILTTFHLAAVPALFTFSWSNLAALVIGNWIVGSLGVGLGYHRLLTHRSFKTP